MIGRVFHVKLVDRSFEAVEAAIKALKENPFVKRAAPNYCGDVDGDGDVDLTDAQTIQSFAAHMIDHFPIEE